MFHLALHFYYAFYLREYSTSNYCTMINGVSVSLEPTYKEWKGTSMCKHRKVNPQLSKVHLLQSHFTMLIHLIGIIYIIFRQWERNCKKSFNWVIQPSIQACQIVRREIEIEILWEDFLLKKKKSLENPKWIFSLFWDGEETCQLLQILEKWNFQKHSITLRFLAASF